jgi:glycosyltransferase involved in cell wall biosynthesis
VATQPGIKGVVPGISSKDKVVLWGGGIYNWFDPLTLIRAVAMVAAKHKNVRLFFMGVAHPNPDVAAFDMVPRARQLSDELGLTDKQVFFNEKWVPYAHRADFLADADLGVSTHFEHIETAFSFRTRILDYLWAGLPVVSTEGDAFADLVSDSGAGVVVPYQDVDALGSALEAMLFTDAGSRAAKVSAMLAQSFRWATVAHPLVQFALNGGRAADSGHGLRRIPTLFAAPSWFAGKVRGARAVLARGGVSAVFRRLTRRRSR